MHADRVSAADRPGVARTPVLRHAFRDHAMRPQLFALAYNLNRVQFKTHRFRFRSSPSGWPWKAGTTVFQLDVFSVVYLTPGALPSSTATLSGGGGVDHGSDHHRGGGRSVLP
jgi:hypothetical protein